MQIVKVGDVVIYKNTECVVIEKMLPFGFCKIKYENKNKIISMKGLLVKEANNLHKYTHDKIPIFLV